MATRIFYSYLIGHTQFVHTPNKQMQNRACSLMNLHSHRSSVEKKTDPARKRRFEDVFLAHLSLQFLGNRVLFKQKER